MIPGHTCLGKVGLGDINAIIQNVLLAWLLYDGPV
jgi:hypothetical protein